MIDIDTNDDHPPTIRTTVSPASGGNYREIVTEGGDMYGMYETRPWEDLPNDEKKVWIDHIEGVHDAYVRALGPLTAAEHRLWTEVWENFDAEWEDEPVAMNGLIDLCDGLQVRLR